MNGRADAGRHAYWNAALTIWFRSDRIAREWTTAWERSGIEDGAEHNSTIMDLDNNANGRAIGRSLLYLVGIVPDPVLYLIAQEIVIDAVDDGAMTILDDLDNNLRDAVLIRSNQ